MPAAKSFTFGDYAIDIGNSTLTFRYEVELDDGTTQHFTDTLIFLETRPEMWERIPESVLASFCEALSLACGLIYWKVYCAPRMHIKNFELSESQAQFWDTVYTKGFGEFYYKSKIDFRGLVSFPFNVNKEIRMIAPIWLRKRALLSQGGGKDSIVSAQFLRERHIPFGMFVFGRTSMQSRVVQKIGGPLVQVLRRADPALVGLYGSRNVLPGSPSGITQMFVSLLSAVLHDYRYVVLSNEYSADLPNTTYLGMEVNHQWRKSTEAELLMCEYIKSNISPDIKLFSLLRQYTEIEMVRRFAAYPEYFFVFSSCNYNFALPKGAKPAREERAYWCNSCPKCAFIFACLCAFVPKATVIDIFGENLYSKPEMQHWFKELLGLEGFKPFECVGSAEEMIVAMRRAFLGGEYADTLAMGVFSEHFSHLTPADFDAMEKRVFALHGESLVPHEFMRIGTIRRSIATARKWFKRSGVSR